MALLTDIWEPLASSLDISDSLYDDAVERYQAVGTWLSREDSALAGRAYVHAQGSFALGTVIRPISDNEEYDVDLISRVSVAKNQITQKRLKELIGAEVEQYHDRYNFTVPLSEDDFCWTLEYADHATFKMDIVPAVRESPRISAAYGNSPIAITDRNSPYYQLISSDWKYSDPNGYAGWFRSRMLVQLNERRNKAAQVAGKTVDQIPEHRIKTPLQRVVQLLKRHRNVTLQGNDLAPSSIVITTLAALIYRNESDIATALGRIIRELPASVQRQGSVLWLPNPVDPSENLVQSWNANREQSALFTEWCASLQELLPALNGSASSAEVQRRAKIAFGERIVEKSAAQLSAGKDVNERRVVASLPAIFRVPHRIWPNWSFRYERKCSVSAVMQKDGVSRPITADGVPLPKFSQLEFCVETDTPPPYNVRYQVVNTGREAERDHGLRGGITDKSTFDISSFPHNESTKYTGKHYIEFFILKNGVCVARSGPFIVNIE